MAGQGRFGALLREHRISAGFSQAHLAELSGMSVETIGALERGTRRAPYRSTIKVLATALELTDAMHAELEASATLRREKEQNLPSPLAPFFGRENEVAAVMAMAERHHLITITGFGGVGKTRLAIEAGRVLQPRFAETWFVDFAAPPDECSIPHRIASAINGGDPGIDSIDRLLDVLRDRNVLLVADTCEHLVDTLAPVVDRLLQACPRLRIIATSRERFGIAGEAVFRLDPLPVPEIARDDARSARRLASVELFTSRAAAAKSDLLLCDDDVPAVAEICRRLDGLPLAIELAVERLPALGLAALCARLDEDAAKNGGRRDLPARQRTMAASMEWSFSLLSERQKTLFRRIAIFPEAWTLMAAENVCCGSPLEASLIASELAALVDKSLVNVDRRENRARYKLLATARSFASKKLANAGEHEALRLAHARWVAQLPR